MTNEFYQRHPWDEEFQNKLGSSKIAIVGDGIIVDYLATSVVALGAGVGQDGYLSIYTNTEDGFLKKWEGDRITTLKALSPTYSEEITRNFSQKKLSYAPKASIEHSIVGCNIKDDKPDIVIAAINREHPKSLEYIRNLFVCCNERNVKLILVEANSYKGVVYYPKNIENITDLEFLIEHEQKQSPSVCGVVSGIAIESMRRLIADKPDDVGEKNVYNLRSSCLDSIVDDFEEQEQDYSKLNALVVGAGAVGNFVALNLVLSGVKELTILDYDHIQKSNFNRQICLYGREGSQKVDVLKERLLKLNPELKINAINLQLCVEKTKEFKKILKENNINAIIGCVDQVRPRLLLTYFTTNNYSRSKIPYIDAGCDISASEGDILPFLSADVHTYIPQKSSCVVCKQEDMILKVKPNVAEVRVSCTTAPEIPDPDLKPTPSVITNNMIAASCITGEILRAVNNSERMHTYVNYTTREICRQVNGQNTEPCSCKPGEKPKYLKLLHLDANERSDYGR